MTAQEIQNVRTRPEWAVIINADWRKSIEGIIQTGRDLIAAKDELPRGEFAKMVEMDLLFSRRTAQQLMQIAGHPAIANAQPGTDLPPSWVVLARLASLSADDFRDAQDRGLINADTSKRKASAVAGAYKTPVGGSVGKGKIATELPSPKEAREL